jgi:plasmid replication initiation protein
MTIFKGVSFMEKLELKNELVVKKSEQLIYSKYKLSAPAQKLVTTVISLVQEEDESNKEYSILAKDFLELCGTKTNNREYLKDACEEIFTKPLNAQVYQTQPQRNNPLLKPP